MLFIFASWNFNFPVLLYFRANSVFVCWLPVHYCWTFFSFWYPEVDMNWSARRNMERQFHRNGKFQQWDSAWFELHILQGHRGNYYLYEKKTKEKRKKPKGNHNSCQFVSELGNSLDFFHTSLQSLWIFTDYGELENADKKYQVTHAQRRWNRKGLSAFHKDFRRIFI